MNFETLETDRLILRKLSPSDFTRIFENYSQEEIMELLGHTSEEEYIQEQIKCQKGYTTYNRSVEHFQIIDKKSMNIIGSCKFHNWYLDHKRAELGYAITNEDFKGIGIMSETLKPLIEYGFSIMGLHRIEAYVGSNNIPSLKLMEKFNFIKEGYLRQHYFIDGNFEDSVLFSKLSTDL
ncbi:MAG: N-acetyltransferase [Pedobacter sp.]|nr:MAG: N-acetyltransferase [Pedobacter sp.]